MRPRQALSTVAETGGRRDTPAQLGHLALAEVIERREHTNIPGREDMAAAVGDRSGHPVPPHHHKAIKAAEE